MTARNMTDLWSELCEVLIWMNFYKVFTPVGTIQREWQILLIQNHSYVKQLILFTGEHNLK